MSEAREPKKTGSGIGVPRGRSGDWKRTEVRLRGAAATPGEGEALRAAADFCRLRLTPPCFCETGTPPAGSFFSGLSGFSGDLSRAVPLSADFSRSVPEIRCPQVEAITTFRTTCNWDLSLNSNGVPAPVPAWGMGSFLFTRTPPGTGESLPAAHPPQRPGVVSPSFFRIRNTLSLPRGDPCGAFTGLILTHERDRGSATACLLACRGAT